MTDIQLVKFILLAFFVALFGFYIYYFTRHPMIQKVYVPPVPMQHATTTQYPPDMPSGLIDGKG